MFKRHPAYRRILVSGCARSGTHLYCDLLNAIGIRVRHEYRARDGIVSHLAGGMPGAQEYRIRVMLLRNPLGIIRSSHTIRIRTWTRISSCLEYDMTKHAILERCMLYYVKWNELLEQNMKPQIRVRIEDVELAGVRKSRRNQPQYGRNVTWKNMTHRYPDLTAEVRRVARSYRYALTELR